MCYRLSKGSANEALQPLHLCCKSCFFFEAPFSFSVFKLPDELIAGGERGEKG